MDEIQAIKRSLRCFVFGLLALIPLLGLPLAVMAWRHGLAVERQFKHQWNPARLYLRWGTGLGLFGLLSSLLLLVLIILG